MAKPSYVKFETTKEVSDKILEAARMAKQSKDGSIKKGINEVTKSIERGLASFVILAEDVQPEEVVMHIPQLCEQRKVSFGYVPDKMSLGKSIGLNVPCSAISIEKTGEAAQLLKEVASKISGKSVDVAKKAEKKEAKPEAKPEKKEEKQAEKKAEKKEEKKAEAKSEAKPEAKQEAKPEAAAPAPEEK